LGAFAAASCYTKTQGRAWLTSGVEKATVDALREASRREDPYTLRHYGEMWVDLLFRDRPYRSSWRAVAASVG